MLEHINQHLMALNILLSLCVVNEFKTAAVYLVVSPETF